MGHLLLAAMFLTCGLVAYAEMEQYNPANYCEPEELDA